MPSLLIPVLLITVLVWGTIGALAAPAAGLPTWIGAALSACLPVVGVILLGLIGLRPQSNPRSLQPDVSRAEWGWLGVGMAGAVAVAAFPPWFSLAVSGSVEVASVDEYWDSKDIPAFHLTIGALGVSAALAAWATTRRGQRAWLALVVLALALPTFIALVVVLTSATLDLATRQVSSLDDFLIELLEPNGISVEDATVDYSVAWPPFVVAAAGLGALLWAMLWSLRKQVSPAAMPYQVGQNAMLDQAAWHQGGADWSATEIPASSWGNSTDSDWNSSSDRGTWGGRSWEEDWK